MIPADDAHLPLHVVQVGLDDTIFQTAAPSDTRERQVAYGRALAALAPGARMTFVSATRRRAAAAFTIENVTFRPMPWSRWRRWTGLAPVLDGIHRDCPI